MKHRPLTVLITGTGQAGTTLLMHALTLCGLPTGYTKSRATKDIDENGHGLETDLSKLTYRDYPKLPSIIKDTEFMIDSRRKFDALDDFNMLPLTVIIPFRMNDSVRGDIFTDFLFWNAHRGLMSGGKTLFLPFPHFATDIIYSHNVSKTLEVFAGMNLDPDKLAKTLNKLYKKDLV